MAKFAADAVMDGALAVIATATIMGALSAQPSSYSDAFTTKMLSTVVMAGGDFANAQGDAGAGTRKVTIGPKSGVSVTNGGTATYVALGISGSSTLLYYTTCTSQVLTSGNTMTFNAWKVEFGAPT